MSRTQGPNDPEPVVGSKETQSVGSNLVVNSTLAMSRALQEATAGGAPQPAESTADARRIAWDGQAYTWPQFVEEYGDDAQRCWDEATAGGAPQAVESTAEEVPWKS